MSIFRKLFSNSEKVRNLNYLIAKLEAQLDVARDGRNAAIRDMRFSLSDLTMVQFRLDALNDQNKVFSDKNKRLKTENEKLKQENEILIKTLDIAARAVNYLIIENIELKKDLENAKEEGGSAD